MYKLQFFTFICYSHWDRRTYASDFHFMRSRELTSGFDFWSRGHLRMSVMHLTITFGADILIQSGVIDTHSLVDLPRWGLATADDHSDIFLLHCARSCHISFSWMYSQPVYFSMSCIHCLLGLPWCRNPSMIPSRTISANCPALPHVSEIQDGGSRHLGF